MAEGLSYVVLLQVGVGVVEPVVQDGDNHAFTCDALTPHTLHVHVVPDGTARLTSVILSQHTGSKYRFSCGSSQPRRTLWHIMISI